MARCGRCGLLKEDDTLGDEIGGFCLWYRMDVPKDALWQHRNCSSFHKRLSGWSAQQHWDFTRARSDMFDSYLSARRAMFFAAASLALSLCAFALTIWG